MRNIEYLNITSTEFLEESVILFSFNNEWQQEDIKQLSKLIIAQLLGVSTIEHVQGADREMVRIWWQQGYFVLNFEYYSQSCWLEAEDENSREKLGFLYQQLLNF